MARGGGTSRKAEDGQSGRCAVAEVYRPSAREGSRWSTALWHDDVTITRFARRSPRSGRRERLQNSGSGVRVRRPSPVNVQRRRNAQACHSVGGDHAGRRVHPVPGGPTARLPSRGRRLSPADVPSGVLSRFQHSHRRASQHGCGASEWPAAVEVPSKFSAHGSTRAPSPCITVPLGRPAHRPPGSSTCRPRPSAGVRSGGTGGLRTTRSSRIRRRPLRD
jgi:hypothetical protein